MADSFYKIDISNLPKIAQQELYDFYLFLLQKYSKYNNSEEFKNGLNIFPGKVDKFTPLKREDHLI